MTVNLPLSIVVPVKNDAANLEACLPLLTEFDDVQIVDSGSTDETSAVAARWGRPVVQFSWNGQFPKKRNWALRNLTFKHPWVLFLDADERVTEAWKREVAEVLPQTDANAFVCYYDNWFAGRMLRHGDTMRKTAMLRVGKGEYERIEEDHWSSLDMEIHEHLQVTGRTDEIKARLEHHDKRSLESHWEKHVQYANWETGRYRQLMAHPECWNALTARQRKKYGNITKWWLAPAYFVLSYFVKRGFLDGAAGFNFALFKLRYFRMVRSKIRHAKLANQV